MEFKVGDEIVVKNTSVWEVTHKKLLNKKGIIIKVDDDDGDCLVRFENWNLGHGDNDDEYWINYIDIEPYNYTPQTPEEQELINLIKQSEELINPKN